MLQYLIKTIEHSLGTAILIALLLMIAYRDGAALSRRAAPIAAAAGAGVAAILSWVIHTTVWINREFLNIGILSAAIAAGLVFIPLSFGVFRKKAPRARKAALDASLSLLSAALLVYCLPTVILYPSEFLLAGESVFSTDFLFKTIGYLAGLLIVFLAALALFRTRNGIPDRLLRMLLTVCLAINIVDQFSAIVQFLLARRIIPMSKGVFEFVKLTVNYDNWFLYLILLITLPLPFLLWALNARPRGTWENPARLRKLKSTARRIRRYSALILVCYVLSVISLTVVKAYDEREVTLSPAEPMNIVAARIFIPTDRIDDGHLHRFAYISTEGIEVRFIVIKKNESAWGVGLDACDICGATGYYERDDEVICKLCDVVMNKSTIGFKGGCNPVPLAYEITGGNMIVQIQDLENEQKRFK
ncbi:MAG: Fe-S-containing protein [Clostridiales Family XIII bacterium]|nr:Fe-S-containing protein [Clostridiales Family XIII bacterium]